MDTHETKIYTAILIAACILAVLLSFFFITIIRHQRKNLGLHNQKLLAEITTLENERKRVASDLHDDLGPLLSAVKLQINSVDVTLPDDASLIKNAGRHIDEIIQRIREIANDLMPQALARKSLLVAIQEFTDRINQGHQLLKVKYLQNCDSLAMEKNNEIHVYRIMQEILHNAIRHSEARNVQLSVSCDKNMLIMEIKDDGKGFNQDDALTQGHGLKNIFSRVELLKGEMYLTTKPGEGVNYSIEIPL